MAPRPEPSRPAFEEAKRGSTDLLILALVEDADCHGYDIARQIEDRSDGTLRFTLASLYAMLYRMEARGWIRGRWIYVGLGSAGGATTASPKPACTSSPIKRRDWARFVAALHRVAGVRLA